MYFIHSFLSTLIELPKNLNLILIHFINMPTDVCNVVERIIFIQKVSLKSQHLQGQFKKCNSINVTH